MNKNKFYIPLAAALLVLTVAGCKGKVKVIGDPTKVNLIVEYYNGGYGSKYIENAASRFEELYKDYTSGDLKGVKISLVSSEKIGSNIASSYDALTSDMFFTESMYNYYELVSKNMLLDITDILTEDVESQDGKSIIDLMDGTYKDYIGVDKNGSKHYYALPAGTTFMGLTFDETLFYKMGYMLTDESVEKTTGSVNKYIGPTGTPNANGNFAELVTENNETFYRTVEDDEGVTHKLSKGPDGQYGTIDDGMAATYDSFFKLCDYMKDNVIPFTSYSKGGGYDWRFANQLMCDFEGPEQAMKFWNYTDTKTNLVSVDDYGNFTNLPDVTLNPNDTKSTTNYEIFKTKGNYYALDFNHRMWADGNGYITSKYASGTKDQFDAQDEFMRSLPGGDGAEKAGFLIDGDWWQNESNEKGIFKAVENDCGPQYAFNNRRFKVYSLPKATQEKVGEKRTIVDDGYRQAFILNKVTGAKREIAKKFLQYCFLKDQNIEYTTLTGSVRPMQYSLSTEEENSMTYFAKSVYKTVRDSNVIVPMASNDYFKINSGNLIAAKMQCVKISGISYTVKLREIFDEGYSTKAAFDGCYTCHKDWLKK